MDVASWALLMLLGDHDAEHVVSRLPPPLRAKFTAELRGRFDNAVDANEILWVDNAGGEPAKQVQVVETARRWLQRQRDA